MIIPLGHESNRGRRWPYVTIAIIALNLLVFLVTHARMEREVNELGEVQMHTLQLAATHPDATLTQSQQDLVYRFRRSQPDQWNSLNSTKPAVDDSEAENDSDLDLSEIAALHAQAQPAEQELAQLGQRLDDLQQHSWVAKYAFFPARPNLVAYVTANFLHGGWMHIIFNMWFLWLAGAVLEDAWGRPLYAAVYMFSGMGALLTHALIYKDSLLPVVGASGAIAALMGAFLVRFPKTKIQLGFFYWIIRPKLHRFSWPAYAVLPLWFAGQLLSGILPGSAEGGGVAYWAHIGGFSLGVIAALVLRYSGIEQKMDDAIEAKVGWLAGKRIVKAGEHLERNEFDHAIAELKAEIAEKPDSVAAWEMLPNLYWKKGDVAAYQSALETACRLHLKDKNPEAAWQDFEDYSRSGGKMPAATWMELCRYAEDEQKFERAADEYEQLAAAWPTERTSILALISAARIHFRLGNSSNARKLYTLAQNSPVPHRDWDETIRKGLEKAGGAIKPEPPKPVAEEPDKAGEEFEIERLN